VNKPKLPLKKAVLGSEDDPLLRVERGSDDPFTALGDPGTAIWGGWIVEQEKDADLTGTEKYRTFDNIVANVSIVAAGARLFLNLISKASWTVLPAEETPEAQRIADAVQKVMDECETSWTSIVRQAATYRLYGFSIMEWTAKLLDDGTIGFDNIDNRPQVTIERWDRDRNGKIVGVVQRSPQTFEEIYLPRQKILYLVDDSLNDSPEGLGLFRHLVKDAHKLRRYELLEGWGYERDLRGVPVGRAPLAEIKKKLKNGDMTETQADAQLEPLKNFVSKALKGISTGILLDSQTYRAAGETKQPTPERVWDIQLLSGQSVGLTDMAKAIDRLTRNLARALGVEQILLGENRIGSHALAKDKTQTLGMIIDSTLGEMGETFEKDILRPLFELNGWSEDLKPTFKIEQVQYRDLDSIGEFIKSISQAGAPLMPTDPAIPKLYELLGLPAPDPEEAMQLLTQMNQPMPGEEPEEPSEDEDSDDMDGEDA
jgi:hypothetical protein